MELKDINDIIRKMDECLELKLAVMKHLDNERTEQIYMNKLNVERDM